MPDLPVGTVSFLFTDIEGSTRLVKQLREMYGEVMAEHQRLLRKAFAAHGGHEVDTQGDSFFVAFARARDAVLASVEGQRRLQGHDWPDGSAVRVRMGVHTGQGAPTNGHYTGLAVHRAARICASGHGGQILLSHATQTLLEDEEEDLEISLRDLGEHQLKDLDRPVRLYQVVAAGLPSEFPPIRPAAELAHAADVVVAARFWRRGRIALLGAGAALGLVFLTALLALTGGSAVAVTANSTAVIDARSGKVVADVPVGSVPDAVSFGAGSIWVANTVDRTVSQIDATSRKTIRTIPLDATPTDLTVGNGAVWVAHGLLRGNRPWLSRIDPQFHSVQRIRARGALVASGEGAVWVVVGGSVVARLDPPPGRTPPAYAGLGPAALAVGGNAVWVSNSRDNTVSKIDPGTGTSASITVGKRPQGLAVGDGAVWVADSNSNEVTRIDPSSTSTTTIRVGTHPEGIAVGKGAVWVVDSYGGTVSKIDPRKNVVVATIKLGERPTRIASDGRELWVTVQPK